MSAQNKRDLAFFVILIARLYSPLKAEISYFSFQYSFTSFFILLIDSGRICPSGSDSMIDRNSSRKD